MPTNTTTTIGDRMVYLVVCHHAGGNYTPERDVADLDRAGTVRHLAEGQFGCVAQVIELNPAEHTSRDVTEDIARDVLAVWAQQGEPLSDCQYEFIELHLGIAATRSFERTSDGMPRAAAFMRRFDASIEALRGA